MAAPDDQERWIDAARCSTASQLERVVHGARRVRKAEEDAADPEHAAWATRASKTYDQDGNAVYRIVLPAEQAAILDAGLEAMQAELDRRAAGASAEAGSPQEQGIGADAGASAEASSPQPATLADALVEMPGSTPQLNVTETPPWAGLTILAGLIVLAACLFGWLPEDGTCETIRTDSGYSGGALLCRGRELAVAGSDRSLPCPRTWCLRPPWWTADHPGSRPLI